MTRLFALLGILGISFSAILVKQADVSPSTAAFFRTAYAVPVLFLLWMLVRRRDHRSVGLRWMAVGAGLFLALDLSVWHRSIDLIGAGLATVLANTQVVFVGLAAWVIYRERPTGLAFGTIPIVIAGVVLISGLGRADAFGDDPLGGVAFGMVSGAAYAVFLLVFRASNRELAPVAGPLLDATIGAAIGSLLLGAADTDFSFAFTWPGHGWLLTLAMVSQVCGWLLIAAVLPRLINRFSRLDLDRIKKCETRYYIGRILDIDEEETLSKKIELNLVGLKVHSIFTELYRDLDEIDRPCRFESFGKKFDELFEANFPKGTFYTNEEALAKKILKNSLLQVVKNDLSRFNDGYSICREFIEKSFSVEIGIDPDKYTIQGRIDRVDRTPTGGYIIVDYKTGKLPANALHFARKDFIEVQLGFYGLLFKKTCPDHPIEGLCYYDLMDKKDIEMVVRFDKIDQYLTDFEDHLAGFFRAFNMKDRVSLAADYEVCRYCPYFNICRVLEE